MSLSSPPSRTIVGALLLSALVVLQPTGAAAAEDKAKAAKKACISGDYTRGVELLADLYVETNDLNHVFNQGRCFEQSGRYQDAINSFHEYARKLRDTGKPTDPKAEQHIAECQEKLGKQTSPAPVVLPVQPPAPAPVAPAPVPAAAPVAAEPAPSASPPAEPIAPAASTEASSGKGLRIAGLAVAGLGVAGVATGLILNLKANQIADDLGSSVLSYSRKRDDTRSSYKTWGWVSYGVARRVWRAVPCFIFWGAVRTKVVSWRSRQWPGQARWARPCKEASDVSRFRDTPGPLRGRGPELGRLLLS